MLPVERREAILKMVQQQGAVEVADLTRRFSASPSTIRRDLEWLAGQDKIARTYGGAVAVESPKEPMAQAGDVARRVGRAAADLIPAGESVFIGPGVLCQATAQQLQGRTDLAVITNSLVVAWTLFRNAEIPLILTGGPVMRPDGALTGQTALQTLQALRADRLVLEVAGVSPVEGLTSDQLPLAELLRPLMETVPRITVLATGQRLGRVGAAWLGPASSADVVITTRDASDAMVWDLTETGVKVTLV
jgi:DeoR/GlpR family transcriptional regulator of sugar metabolism